MVKWEAVCKPAVQGGMGICSIDKEVALESGGSWSRFTETTYIQQVQVMVGGCRVTVIMVLAYGGLSFLLKLNLIKESDLGFMMGIE